MTYTLKGQPSTIFESWNH